MNNFYRLYFFLNFFKLKSFIIIKFFIIIKRKVK